MSESDSRLPNPVSSQNDGDRVDHMPYYAQNHNIHNVDMLLRDDEDNENSPLLYGASSLPTVLLDDDQYSTMQIDQSVMPNTSTVSEGGRLMSRDQKKRRRPRRKRLVSDSVIRPTMKTRFASVATEIRRPSKISDHRPKPKATVLSVAVTENRGPPTGTERNCSVGGNRGPTFIASNRNRTGQLWVATE
ncbi:unnamed protein product [Anisakis simplex]|uniref:Uncharacterized protein n=1 Tax=Anisakis simplex TaxID=6269 RepID=A0A0M3JSP4_ANISI|nr:unnamed protein product [Anisakis simplex]